MANKQDECKGAFFEGRYKSIAILDEEALLTVWCVYRLEPCSGWYRQLPEESPHTSIKGELIMPSRKAHVRCG